MVEQVSRRQPRLHLANLFQEFHVERDDDAPRDDAVLGGEAGDPARHHASVVVRRRLDLDDITERGTVAVKDVLETRDSILAVLRWKLPAPELATRAAAHGHAVAREG